MRSSGAGDRMCNPNHRWGARSSWRPTEGMALSGAGKAQATFHSQKFQKKFGVSAIEDTPLILASLMPVISGNW